MKAAFMEWDSKMTLWALPELEQNDAEATLSLDCSVDLKLGGLGALGLAESWKQQRRSSTASSSKRQRAPSNSNQTVLCLVDDCKSDLSSCKEYHRRHKVCELHSKTPVVMVGGQEQRFCQQCSRFHLLMEFDEVKRSCRKRLDGHNRRRRKPQVEATNAGNLYSTQHGSRFTSYPQNFASAGIDPAWSSMVKLEEGTLYPMLPPPINHFVDRVQQPPSHHFAATFDPNYKEDKQFFLHDHTSRMAIEPTTACQPLLNTISSAAESSSNGLMFSDRLSQVFDSDCALSLLSSSAQTSGINQSHMGQPLLSNLHYGGYSHSPMEEEHVGTVLVPDSGETDLHCQSMFQVGDEEGSDCGSESIPFSWQ
ncbi:squamosa promoter-binding-like protein 18 [Phalaenopsis equestris]|uniref:squamosa promoter-binding-like protein 18 n=1 Tax=Phalaenopsis equestris TaxID=78828 RepID=UPI0009E61C62|nr:squamosa promoter-binding-like protein 18 [Phalaenopsis equestris]